MALQNTTNSKNSFLQFVSASTATVATCSTAMPADDTIPQKTEGDEIVTVSITPKSATSVLQIQYTGFVTKDSTTGTIQVGLFQDTTANALTAKSFAITTLQDRSVNILYTMTSGTTSSTTFKIRIGPGANSAYTNANDAGTRLYGGVAFSLITIIEHL
jgi:hypothetical protein